LPSKSSRNEECALIVFLWARKINANLIHSEMQREYGKKCFMNQTLHVWCKKMLDGQKFVSYIEVQFIVLCIGHSEVY